MSPRSLTSLCIFVCIAAAPKPKPHNLPAVDLKQTVIWGSIAPDDGGNVLAFGGMDQSAPDGIAHTRIQIAGKWVPLYEHLRKYNPAQPLCDRLRKLHDLQKELLGANRLDLP